MQEIEGTIFCCIDNLTEKDIVESNLYYEMEYEETPLIMKAENDIFISEMIISEGCIRVSDKQNNKFLYWLNEYFSPKSVYFDRDAEGFKIYYDSEKYRMDLYGVEGGQKVKFTLRNIKGDKIYEDEVICKCNPECCVIDLKDKLPFGLYSLTWDTRGKLFTHKFIAH